jgi:tetratricopeptide (TPR) repeat protein
LPDLTYNPRILVACLLAQLTLLALVYAQTANFGYVYVDDAQYVLANGQVRAGLSLEGLRWALGSFYMSNWHPLTWLSHMLDASLFGTAPGPAHLHNVLLHGLVSLLVFVYLRRFGAELAAALLSLLFLAHPLHVESVAWVAERKDLLSALFFLLALLLYDRFQGRLSTVGYLGVALCYLLAVLSKAMAVTLPALLVVLDLCWYRHPVREQEETGSLLGRGLRSVLHKLPLFTMAAAFSAVAIIAQREGGALVTAETASLLDRLTNAGYGYLVYLRQSLLPLGLAAFYPLDMQKSLLSLVLPLVLLLVWAFAAWRWWASRPLLAAGLAWYLLTLLPVIGLIQVGLQLHADRYMYLPSVGVLLALLAVFPSTESPRFRLGVMLAGVFLLFCTMIAHWQAAYWENRQTLFTRVLAVVGPNWRSHAALAAEYVERREFEYALQHAEAAMRLDPTRPESYQALGDIAMQLGDPNAASRYYLAGLENTVPTANMLNNLGMAQLALAQYDDALQSLALALALEPDAIRIRNNLARVEREIQQQDLQRDKQ